MQSQGMQMWERSRPKAPPFDTACIAPWVSLEFDPSGWVYACCTSQLYPLGRIGEDRLAELWNGPRAAVLKDALRRRDMSVACQPCRFHIEHGRMETAAAVYDQYPLEDAEPAGPHMMLFALSNRCNLGCIMCSPALSSTLQAEAGLAPLRSPYDDQFFEDLEPMLRGLGMAKFLGGEPFLASEHKRIWQMLDAHDDPPMLSVTTNGTIWTDTVDWLMDRFAVDISVSVDAATAETYAAVRRGGELAVVHQNMERFAQRCREKGTNLHVSYCLMPQNASELGQFLVWAEQYTFGAPAYVNLVTDEGAALHDLPTEQLRQIRRRWEREDSAVSSQLERNLRTWRTQLDQLDQVISERERSGEPVTTRAHPVRADVLRPDPAEAARQREMDATSMERRHAEELAGLRSWSEGGEVAAVRCDDSGCVVAVDQPHERLGINESGLVGRSVGDILEVASTADGRDPYVLDTDETSLAEHGIAVHTIVLADHPPTRGAEGTILRIVRMPAAEGHVYAIAENRIYDLARRELEPIPVALRARHDVDEGESASEEEVA